MLPCVSAAPLPAAGENKGRNKILIKKGHNLFFINRKISLGPGNVN
jgi:hypothetical protein